MVTKQIDSVLSVCIETPDGDICVDNINFEGTWESEPDSHDTPGMDRIEAETTWTAKELHDAFKKEAKECGLPFDWTESEILAYVNAQIEEEACDDTEFHVYDSEDCH